ncbi:STAS domain-containing protein [Streptomyces bohaiensis]|uniref:Anti-sigma factor antagonist n=1 Tax=Streptomyces bohaiensis TaxID=1431344 RepID=A0ABX1CCK3_9ACTN|nr:STAS domain-containing protein [Streptomyces bohaiensis]NJQ15605.1 STAS domain-containing protein [Streptomyces bohaiensis]
MKPLTIAPVDAASGPVLEVGGELDYATAPALRAAVKELQPGVGQLLLLDLGNLTFCDSSGIAVFVAALNHAAAHGAELALAAVPPQTVRVLSVTGLAQVLAMHEHVEGAVAAHLSRG